MSIDHNAQTDGENGRNRWKISDGIHFGLVGAEMSGARWQGFILLEDSEIESIQPFVRKGQICDPAVPDGPWDDIRLTCPDKESVLLRFERDYEVQRPR